MKLLCPQSSLDMACCMSLAVDVSGAPDLDHEIPMAESECQTAGSTSYPLTKCAKVIERFDNMTMIECIKLLYFE